MSNENKKLKGAAWGCIGCLSALLVVVLIVGAVLGVSLLRGTEVPALFPEKAPAAQPDDAAVYGPGKSLSHVTDLPAVSVANESDAVQALGALQSVIGFSDLSEFAAPVRTAAPHYTYYRFAQKANGMEVEGYSVILCIGQDGSLRSVAGSYLDLDGMDTSIKHDAASAAKTLHKQLGKDAPVFVKDRCIIVHEGMPVCAWRALVYANGQEKLYYVSVKNGKVLSEVSLASHYDVQGNGRDETGEPRLFTTDQGDDGVFTMKDNGRSIILYDAHGGDVPIGYTTGNIGLVAPETGECYTFFIEDGTLVQTEAEEDGTQYYILPLLSNRSDEIVYLYERAADRAYSLRTDDGTILTNDPALTFVPHEDREDSASLITDEDNIWHNYTAVSAKYAIEQAYDLYESNLLRKGYDGMGSTLHLTINDIKDSGVVGKTNAYDFSGFGQKTTVIQLENGVPVRVNETAHEYTHAVIRSITGSPSAARENRMLEEGLCDFFGELAEDFADDHFLNNGCDWVNSSRNLADPTQSSAPMPVIYKGPNWYSDQDADQNNDAEVQVHHNSTVLSHALYRMSMGLGEDEHIEPVGNLKLAFIVYDAMQSLSPRDGFAQFADLLRSSAHKMCADGIITEKQARCVYIALENALLYPTFEVAPDAELTFRDLKDAPAQNHALSIREANLDARPMLVSGKETTAEIADGTYRLSLEEGKSYQIVLSDRDDPSMTYTAQLRIKAGGSAKQVVKTDVFPHYTVINNGGRYVTCGSYTYYWKYNDGSFAKTGLLGYFAQNTSVHNQLIRRDANGMEDVIVQDTGYGGIYIAKQRIHYRTDSGFKSCALDGTQVRSHAGEFEILGVEPDTDTLIYRDLSDRKATKENQIYIEDAAGNRIGLSADNFDYDGQAPQLLAAGGGQIYYMRNHDNRDGNHGLIVLGADMTGQTRLVGTVTYARQSDEGVEVSAQLVDDMLYVSYALVQGSGMYYNNGGVSAMNVTREEACETIIDQRSKDALCFAATHVSKDPDTGAKTLHYCREHGANVSSNWLENNVMALDLESGRSVPSALPLVRTGDHAVMGGSIVTVRGTDAQPSVIASAGALAQLGYREFTGASGENGGYELTDVDVMGDYAFIEITETKRDKSEDVGWRYGYRRERTVIYVTKIGTDELRILYEY